MNVFEQLESDASIPHHVKEEMLSSLDTIKLVADVVDLFFIKGGWVASQSLGSYSGAGDETPSSTPDNLE